MSRDEEGAPAASLVDSVASAYFAKEIGAADAARERAQRSYTIAGAIATTLLAVGIFADLSAKPTLVKVIGLVTLLGWAIVAMLFMHAVATPIERVIDGRKISAGIFVTEALKGARDERDEIDRRLTCAQIAASLAIASTLVTVAAAVAWPAERATATVALSREGRASIAAACQVAPETAPLVGELELASLGEDFVVVHVGRGACRTDRAAELYLRKADVLAIDP